MTKLDNAARTEVSDCPLIVYVHVPKTAGTTVKKLLAACTPDGVFADFILPKEATFIGLARRCDWIAGHIPRDTFAHGLTWVNRPIEYFSSVREPIAQLISHLNFCFERYERSQYYNVHDINVQKLDADVMSTNFSDPSAVRTLLLKNSEHYFNAQSRYVLGIDFGDLSNAEVSHRLTTYKYVSNEYDMPKLYRAFGFAKIPEGADERRENVAKRHINAEVFDSPELRELLAHHHQHDLRLYAAVRHASWSAEGRRPYRPSLLEASVFTPENFDERSYLSSNPDVADAVARGEVASGRAHFEHFGHKERRMMRRWVSPPTATSEKRSNEVAFTAPAALERLRRRREEHARLAAEWTLTRGDRDERKSASINEK